MLENYKQLLRMTGDGYAQTCPITPYIHLMIYHVPEMLQKYKNMKIFTGQGKTIRATRAAYQYYLVQVSKRVKSVNIGK